MKPRYSVYAPKNGLTPQLRDDVRGIVIVAPTMGGQWATLQSPGQAKTLLRKIAKLLNNQ